MVRGRCFHRAVVLLVLLAVGVATVVDAAAVPERPLSLHEFLLSIQRSPEANELVGKSPELVREDNVPLTPADFAMAETVQDAGAPKTDELYATELAELFEGDIVFSSKDFLTLNEDNAIVKEQKKWPNAIIPYTLSSAFSNSERAIIAAAMQEFHEKTCIRFQPVARGSYPADLVQIVKKIGCSSSVGRQGGQQELSLGEGCLYKGIAMHELMHATGFWHEQSRPDRDDYVFVYYDNIKRGLEYNFQKYSRGEVQTLDEQYDIGSIMHYGPYAFARDRRRPTIKARYGSGANMGQRRQFSDVDIAKLNKLYSCRGGGTGGGGSGSTTTPAPVPEVCEDKSENCHYWATRGECSRNPVWMHDNCALSCKKCTKPGRCTDLTKNCKYWASTGECTINPSYMNVYCKKSCKTCQVPAACKDEYKNCKFWAKNSECSRNSSFMNIYCKKSCQKC